MVAWDYSSLPLKVRSDLAFREAVVVELKFGRKKMFFTVLYRSPSFKQFSTEFNDFKSNFKVLHTKIQAENPYASFFTGDFNGHSQFWWPDGENTPEGKEIEEIFSLLNLQQIISEPTNFTPGKKPPCIDLIATDQPNLILDSGTRPSSDSKCHHQIIYCKVNFKIPPPSPTERKIWHYNRANSNDIKRSMENFPWSQQLNLNTDPNWQVKTFHEIFLNIMVSFIPNEIKKCVPRDPSWINKSLKTLLKKKNRLYHNYKKHGYKEEDKIRLECFRTECKEAVEFAKLSYLSNLGSKLNEPAITNKNYWKIIHRVMNKCRAPKIPPILKEGTFNLNCIDKAKLFNEYFSNQCKLIVNNSSLPVFDYITDKRIDSIPIKDNELLLLIRKLNPNKATGPDGISSQMLLICDNSAVLPLKLIFRNILETSIYPNMWKLANVIPIFKKMTNN